MGNETQSGIINIFSGLTYIDEKIVSRTNDLSSYIKNNYIAKSDIDDITIINDFESIITSGINSCMDYSDKISAALDVKCEQLSSLISSQIYTLSTNCSSAISFLSGEIDKTNITVSKITDSTEKINHLSADLYSLSSDYVIPLSADVNELSATIKSVIPSTAKDVLDKISGLVVTLKDPKKISGVLSADGFNVVSENTLLDLAPSSINFSLKNKQSNLKNTANRRVFNKLSPGTTKIQYDPCFYVISGNLPYAFEIDSGEQYGVNYITYDGSYSGLNTDVQTQLLFKLSNTYQISSSIITLFVNTNLSYIYFNKWDANQYSLKFSSFYKLNSISQNISQYVHFISGSAGQFEYDNSYLSGVSLSQEILGTANIQMSLSGAFPVSTNFYIHINKDGDGTWGIKKINGENHVYFPKNDYQKYQLGYNPNILIVPSTSGQLPKYGLSFINNDGILNYDGSLSGDTSDNNLSIQVSLSSIYDDLSTNNYPVELKLNSNRKKLCFNKLSSNSIVTVKNVSSFALSGNILPNEMSNYLSFQTDGYFYYNGGLSGVSGSKQASAVVKFTNQLANPTTNYQTFVLVVGDEFSYYDKNQFDVLLSSTSINLVSYSPTSSDSSKSFQINVGYENKLYGYNSFAYGQQNQIYQSYSFVYGNDNQINSKHSFSIGSTNKISGGNYSSAIGNGLIVTSGYQYVFGKYNAADSSKTFIIGNGTDINNRKNIFTVDRSGTGRFAGNVFASSILLQKDIGTYSDVNTPCGLVRLNVNGKIPSSLISNYQPGGGGGTYINSKDYLPISGGTITGNFAFNKNLYFNNTEGDNCISGKNIQISNKEISIDSVCSNLTDGYLLTKINNNLYITSQVQLPLSGTSYSILNISVGYNNLIQGHNSFTFGQSNIIYGNFSTAFGISNLIKGYGSFAEGYNNQVVGNYNHAQGYQTSVQSNYSHIQGANNKIITNSYYTTISNGIHVEGSGNIVSGEYSDFTHVQGIFNTVNGSNNFVTGRENNVFGNGNFVAGSGNVVYQTIDNITVQGTGLKVTNNKVKHIIGKYNAQINDSNNYLLVIGDGGDNENRENAITIDETGKTKFSKIITGPSAQFDKIICKTFDSDDILHYTGSKTFPADNFLVTTSDGKFTNKSLTDLGSAYFQLGLIQKQFTTSSVKNYFESPKLNGFPIAIKNTVQNNIYLIQTEFLIQSDENFIINVQPYLAYDKSRSQTGQINTTNWLVYYTSNANIEQDYAKNKVYDNGEISQEGAYEFNYLNGDVQLVKVNEVDGELVFKVLNLPKGSAMVIKCENCASHTSIYFNESTESVITSTYRQIINVPGTFYLTVINVNNSKYQLLGDIVQSNVSDF